MVREDLKRRGRRVLLLALIVMSVVLSGCGDSSPVTSVIDLKSPGVNADGVTKANVFCGYGSLWVPLQWGEVPDSSKELAILLARYKRVKEGGKQKVIVQFADLVSKFKPTEHRLLANVLPEGVNWSWFGTNCIPRKGQTLLLEVFALDRALPVSREIDKGLATRLAEEALAHPQPKEEPRSPGTLTHEAAGIGRMLVTYGPPPQESQK